MTPEKLVEIKARWAAASQTWKRDGDYIFAGEIGLLPAMVAKIVDPNWANNAQFIGMAHSDIDALVAEVERLQMIEQAAKKFIEAQGAKKIGAHYDLSVTLGYIHPSGF